eukprot:170952_1
MPHQNTIRIRDDVFNLRDTISSKYFKSMQQLYDEYCDHFDIPLDQRIPFFIQAHDEVYVIKGMFYCPANHKVYGMTSDLKEKMQIKSVFEIFRGIAKITPSKIIQQTCFIDLRSGFRFIGPWIGTASGMSGTYLYDLCMKILNCWTLVLRHRGWKLYGYVSDMGTGNQQLVKLLTGNKRLMDSRCLVFKCPVDDHPMFYFCDPPHALKNARTALLNSRTNSEAPLMHNGSLMTWELPIQCWQWNKDLIDRGYPVYFQNVFRNCVHPPNNWALQRMNYVMPFLKPKFHSRVQVQLDKKHPAFVGCEASLEYFKHLAIFAECAACPGLAKISQPRNLYISNMEHKIFGIIERELEWWDDWIEAARKDSQNNKCVAEITYFAITSWYVTFPELCRYFFEANANDEVIAYINPFTIGQDPLESVFGRIKRINGHKGGLYGAMMNKIRSQIQSKLLMNKKPEAGTKAGHHAIRLKKARNQTN